MLTHGWPGSVIEFFACVEHLDFPERFGGKAEDGFDVVIPSLPGYGFSGKLSRPIGPRTVAGLWRKLMVEGLGYEKFAAQGGDWGAAVTSWLGIDHSDVVFGIHLNMVPSWIFMPNASSSPEEKVYHARVATIRATEMGYFAVQSTKAQTLAFALTDSPVAFAAWGVREIQNLG